MLTPARGSRRPVPSGTRRHSSPSGPSRPPCSGSARRPSSARRGALSQAALTVFILSAVEVTLVDIMVPFSSQSTRPVETLKLTRGKSTKISTGCVAWRRYERRVFATHILPCTFAAVAILMQVCFVRRPGRAPGFRQKSARRGCGGRRMAQLVGVITTSTRRFCARPLALAFEVIGSSNPRPE